jgi:hypothetical protein
MTEFDDTLGRLFAEARESLPAEDFLESVAIGMRRARRRRAMRRLVLMAAAAVLALALTPCIVAGSHAGAGRLSVWLPGIGNALSSPMSWFGALAIAALRRRTGSRFR